MNHSTEECSKDRCVDIMKILIVDDSEIARKLLRVQLEEAGYDIFEAGDCTEAIGILGRQPVAAVITDLNLPKIDGYRLCSEIRKSDTFGAVPIIIYSATYRSPSEVRRCIDLGANIFIEKPASAKVILDAITKVAAESGQQKLRVFQPTEKLPGVEGSSERPAAEPKNKNENFLKNLI